MGTFLAFLAIVFIAANIFKYLTVGRAVGRAKREIEEACKRGEFNDLIQK